MAVDTKTLPRQTLYPNLIRSQPGVSNGGGPPKGRKTIKGVFSKILAYKCNEDLTMLGLSLKGIPPEDLILLTNEEVIAMQMVAKACRGDAAAAQMIYDRTEGKPVQVNQNINTEMTYTEFLDKLATDEKAAVEELLS